MQFRVDQREELPRGDIGVVEFEVAAMGKAGEAGGEGCPCLARSVLAPCRRRVRGSARPRPRSACAGYLPSPLQMQLRLSRTAKSTRSASRLAGSSGNVASVAKMPALVRSVSAAHHRDEQFLLVAMVVVDGLPRHTRFGRDHVDVGAGITLAAKHVGGGVEDRDALGRVATRRQGVSSVGDESHESS